MCGAGYTSGGGDGDADMVADGKGDVDAGGDAGAEDGAGTADDVDAGDSAGELEDAELAFAVDLVVGTGPITCRNWKVCFEGQKQVQAKGARGSRHVLRNERRKRVAVRNADRRS